MEVATQQEPESVRVFNWRRSWLISGGFSLHNAELIADSQIDFRFAIRTLENCKRKGHDEEFVMGLIL